MQPDFLDDAEEWFVRAEQDLQMAQLALKASPVLGSGVTFHAQQAAEKALKGYLTAYGLPFAKTHALLPLLTTCSTVDASFQQLALAAQTLTPYVAEFRYPGLRLKPPDAEAQSAYEYATEILQFVRDALAGAGPPPASR